MKYQSAGKIKLSGFGRRLNGVYDRVHVSGFSHTLESIVCLESITVSGFENQGTIILPPSKKIVDTGFGNNFTIERCKSWREVAARAELI
ncbi:MAG: hypothetical protein AB4368_11545 [Xenococcaceae cyanobacterium]